MAIRLGDVFIALSADRTQLDKDLNQARGQVTSWAGSLGGNITKLMGGVVVGAATAAAGAVVGIGAAAFTAASDFDKATDRMTSQLNLLGSAPDAFNQTMKDIFANNYGESIDDIATSLVAVEQAFSRIGGTESTGELQKATEDALALRDAFGVEVNESVGAATELIDKFGLTSEQAFDFIAKGFQKGLNSSDDFLDSIGEYSTQFANGGADAGQFFSVLETGLQGGVLGTDKAADAFKEFRLRINDGSTLTAESLKMLGINAEQVTRGLSTGALTTADAFQMVLDAIRNTEDPTIRMQGAVGLLGTQYEDLGDSAVAALSLTTTTIDELAGATDSLSKQYDNLPSLFEGFKRRAIVAITPIGEAMLRIANENMPAITAAFDEIEKKVQEFIASSSFTWEPDFKQIKLGDLFEFIDNDTLTYVNLAEYISVVYNKTDGKTDIKIGDLFSLSTGDGSTAINLADYLTFEFKPEGLTSFNLSDSIGTLIGFSSDGEKTSFNLADSVTFTWDKTDGLLQLKIADLITFGDGTGTVNLGEFFTLTWDSSGITKLKIGDFIDLSDTGTLSETVGEALATAASAIGEALKVPAWLQSLIDWRLPTESPAWLTSLMSWTFPDVPAAIDTLLTWLWPDAPKAIDTLLTWSWPDFSAGLTSIINSILAFAWPKFETPEWIDSLLAFSFPTPAWISQLFSFKWPSLPDAPSWWTDLFGASAASVEASSLGVGSVAPSAPAVINVNFYDTIVNNGQDVEQVAYRVASRLAYGV